MLMEEVGGGGGGDFVEPQDSCDLSTDMLLKSHEKRIPFCGQES
jgi:hypothetical protein